MEYSASEENKIDQIINDLNKNQKTKWIETISTILLSAATVLSAWCIFQSSQWNGEQYFRIEDVNVADRNRLQKEIAAYQRQSGEAMLFLQFVDALTNNNEEKEKFLFNRFPPHLKNAVLAWKAMDPVHNPKAPISPMLMKEYVVPEQADIEKYSEQARQFKQAANQCDSNSDNYMLLSLVLSTVLFFSGLSGTTDSKSNKLILIGLATLIFVITIYYVITFPMLL